tara:strand:- start:722 stop:1042 length:321 start_codon:yes stop_codon:yes gene_type:complete
MSTTFTWSINTLDRNTADGIVFTAHYSVDAADDTYSSGAYGSIGLEAPAEGDEVIPYSDLTPEVVIGWVQEKIGGADKVAEIEAALQAQIDEQRTPTKASGIPWSN